MHLIIYLSNYLYKNMHPNIICIEFAKHKDANYLTKYTN